MIRVEPSSPLRQTLRVDIVEFLTARLDEDEQVAQDAASGRGGGKWIAEAEKRPKWGEHPRDRAILGAGKPLVREDHEYSAGVVIDHIARHDPARVLADVAAKRAVIDDRFNHFATIDGEWGCGHESAEIRAGNCPDHTLDDLNRDRTFRALATVRADHPDFDPAWKVGE